MSRPTRLAEALEILQSYYRDNGVLPSFAAMTEFMGYRSPGSTFPVIKQLIDAGYLEKDGRGGRLKPGPNFGAQTPLAPPISIPAGTVVQVSAPAASVSGILPGDFVIYDVQVPPEQGDLIVLHSDAGIGVQEFRQDATPSKGKVLGVLMMQFRRYRE